MSGNARAGGSPVLRPAVRRASSNPPIPEALLDPTPHPPFVHAVTIGTLPSSTGVVPEAEDDGDTSSSHGSLNSSTGELAFGSLRRHALNEAMQGKGRLGSLFLIDLPKDPRVVAVEAASRPSAPTFSRATFAPISSVVAPPAYLEMTRSQLLENIGRHVRRGLASHAALLRLTHPPSAGLRASVAHAMAPHTSAQDSPAAGAESHPHVHHGGFSMRELGLAGHPPPASGTPPLTPALGGLLTSAPPTHGAVTYRDLHGVDPALDASSKPSLVVRNGTILITMPPLHAIILADTMMLFPEEGQDGDLQPVIAHINEYQNALLKTIAARDANGGRVGAPPTTGTGTGEPHSFSSQATLHPAFLAGLGPFGAPLFLPPFPELSGGTFEFEAMSCLLVASNMLYDGMLAKLSRRYYGHSKPKSRKGCLLTMAEWWPFSIVWGTKDDDEDGDEIPAHGSQSEERRIELLQVLEGDANAYVATLEAVLKAVDAVRNTPEDLEGLVLSLPRLSGAESGTVAMAVAQGHPPPAHAADPNRGSTSAPSPSDPAASPPPHPPTHSMSHATPHPPSNSDSLLTKHQLLAAHEMEAIRFEELLEWYAAETENNLSDARLIISKLSGERKRISMLLAQNRNQLLKLNVRFQLITIAMTGCSVVSGFFGAPGEGVRPPCIARFTPPRPRPHPHPHPRHEPWQRRVRAGRVHRLFPHV